MLKMHKRTVHTVDYRDLEEYVKQVYGHEIEIVAMEEASNGAVLNYFVTSTLNDFDNEEVNRWIKTGEEFSFGVRYILDRLCAENYIPAGYYSILVDW